jgi:hypothetical protein
MGLIVETGTGSATSESYASVAFADAYHAARGCAPWATLNTAQKEEALRRATDYIEQVYGLSFQGVRVNSTQALSWPRGFVVIHGYGIESTTIPQILINATAELAFKSAQGNLAPDVSQGVKREKVGQLEVEYMNGSSSVIRFRAIDNILAPILTASASGASKGLIRA